MENHHRYERPGTTGAAVLGSDPTEIEYRFVPGTYGFGYHVGGAADGWFVDRFDVTGDRPPLEPTDEVEKTFQGDDALVVRTRPVSPLVDRPTTTPDRVGETTLFELYDPLLEVVPAYSNDRVLVYPSLTVLLRDGLAHATPSFDRIRVETVDTGIPPSTLSEDEELDVVYDDQPWRVTSQEGWATTPTE